MSPSARKSSAGMLLVAAALWSCAESAVAQRVQFPTAIPESYPSGPVSTAPLSLPGFDPYANTKLGAPPLDLPYTAPALTSPPLSGAPFGATPFAASPQPLVGAPAFGAAPNSLGAIPATTPYGAPLAQSQAAGGGFFQNWHWPNLGLQRGTYDYQNPDGSFVRVQRLLQQVSAEHTWIAGNNGPGDFGVNRTELAATFGVPIFRNPDTPLLITPGFAFNWFEGPAEPTADLPPRVYDAYLDTAWRPRLNDWLSFDLGVRTGVWTDFKAVSTDSIRILGRGLGVVSLSPRLDVLAGVWYIDRNYITLLPAGGVHWRPTPDWDAYLVFPNPKVRRRFVNIGSSQWWYYVGGEYGGGRWTVRRSATGPAMGASDDVDYNDIRIFGGLEWQTQTQIRGHVEAGYVFNRELRYDTGLPGVVGLDNTVMVRAGVDF